MTTEQDIERAAEEGIRLALEQLGITPRMDELTASNIMAEAALRNNLLAARDKEGQSQDESGKGYA